MNTGCDLHIHLGGSITKDLLVGFAASDHDQAALDAIGTSDVIQMFGLVHRLMNSPERVEQSTENVIRSSTADYLEIRTTPRSFSPAVTMPHYVEAFASGLRKHPDKARGLLSIDRYRHGPDMAKEIINLAAAYSDCIVGVDISGINPDGIRALQGEQLAVAIEAVLDSDLGLALHIGELNLEKERIDSTIALSSIARWIDRNQIPDCSGKIRLGHALFLDESHKTTVQKHRLPIEVCPSCHLCIGGWKQGRPHPVQDIYPDGDAPVVIGTDDTLIFSTDFKSEMAIARDTLPYHLDNTCHYRFGHQE